MVLQVLLINHRIKITGDWGCSIRNRLTLIMTNKEKLRTGQLGQHHQLDS